MRFTEPITVSVMLTVYARRTRWDVNRGMSTDARCFIFTIDGSSLLGGASVSRLHQGVGKRHLKRHERIALFPKGQVVRQTTMPCIVLYAVCSVPLYYQGSRDS